MEMVVGVSDGSTGSTASSPACREIEVAMYKGSRNTPTCVASWCKTK